MALLNIIETYVRYNNKRLVAGKGCEAAILMPFLLIDAQNVIFAEYVNTLNLQHSAKRMRSNWADCYRRFNSRFFAAFSDDQKAEIVEKMVELYDFANNEIEMLRVSIMNHFMKYDLETRLTVSAIVCCNHLIQCAQAFWSMKYKKSFFVKDQNPNLIGMETWSLKLLNEYVKGRIERIDKKIDLGDFEDVAKSSRMLVNKIVAFCEKWE